MILKQYMDILVRQGHRENSMLARYLAVGIIGFIIGLTINISMKLEDIWKDVEPLDHVKRHQHIMSYATHPVNEIWALKQEKEFRQAFASTESLKVNYLKCYTDVCAFSLTGNYYTTEGRYTEDWKLAHEKLSKPILIANDSKYDNSGKKLNLWLYQFTTNS